MNYYMGIDGGGTKTAFMLADETGKELSRLESTGTSYKQYGTEAVINNLLEHTALCIAKAGLGGLQPAGICIGLPCFGENPGGDEQFAQQITTAFGSRPIMITNDVEVGWAGSLAGECGINIVAGTGSIAFGQDSYGTTARCGGWSEFFGDEGSCYWAGRMAMELFSKQADYRVPRGALYELVRTELKLQHDFDFIAHIERDYIPYRDKTASFQLMLSRAAEQGDSAAAAIYERAAQELALIVGGTKKQLRLAAGFPVSYSGGIFRAGALVLAPFEQAVHRLGGLLQKPLLTPVQGALLLALRHFAPLQAPAAIQLLCQGAARPQ